MRFDIPMLVHLAALQLDPSKAKNRGTGASALAKLPQRNPELRVHISSSLRQPYSLTAH